MIIDVLCELVPSCWDLFLYSLVLMMASLSCRAAISQANCKLKKNVYWCFLMRFQATFSIFYMALCAFRR